MRAEDSPKHRQTQIGSPSQLQGPGVPRNVDVGVVVGGELFPLDWTNAFASVLQQWLAQTNGDEILHGCFGGPRAKNTSKYPTRIQLLILRLSSAQTEHATRDRHGSSRVPCRSVQRYKFVQKFGELTMASIRFLLVVVSATRALGLFWPLTSTTASLIQDESPPFSCGAQLRLPSNYEANFTIGKPQEFEPDVDDLRKLGFEIEYMFSHEAAADKSGSSLGAKFRNFRKYNVEVSAMSTHLLREFFSQVPALASDVLG